MGLEAVKKAPYRWANQAQGGAQQNPRELWKNPGRGVTNIAQGGAQQNPRELWKNPGRGVTNIAQGGAQRNPGVG